MRHKLVDASEGTDATGGRPGAGAGNGRGPREEARCAKPICGRQQRLVSDNRGKGARSGRGGVRGTRRPSVASAQPTVNVRRRVANSASRLSRRPVAGQRSWQALGLSDPFTEEVKVRDQRPESPRCETGVTALSPKVHMKDTRPSEGSMAEHFLRRTWRPVAPLNPELECKAKKKQSNGQRGGFLCRTSMRSQKLLRNNSISTKARTSSFFSTQILSILMT